MTMVGSSVILMGERFSPAELCRQRSSGEVRIDILVYQQLLVDVTSNTRHSEGLLAVNILWRKPICQRVIGAYLSDVSAHEEVWNRTLEAVITRIEKYDATRSKFSTWVFNLGKYAALNELRRRNRERRSVAAMSNEAVQEVEFYESGFSDLEKRATANALRRLTEGERDLIRQRLVLDLSYDEIFEALGGSIKREHLRIYVSRAVVRLKKFTEEELERR